MARKKLMIETRKVPIEKAIDRFNDAIVDEYLYFLIAIPVTEEEVPEKFLKKAHIGTNLDFDDEYRNKVFVSMLRLLIRAYAKESKTEVEKLYEKVGEILGGSKNGKADNGVAVAY